MPVSSANGRAGPAAGVAALVVEVRKRGGGKNHRRFLGILHKRGEMHAQGSRLRGFGSWSLRNARRQAWPLVLDVVSAAAVPQRRRRPSGQGPTAELGRALEMAR